VGTGWRIDKAVSTKRRREKFLPTGLDIEIAGQPAGQISRAD